MVKKAIKADTEMPINIRQISVMLIEPSSLKRSNISEARIVGILNKNANLEPDLSERPINSAPVIAIPEREAPGNSAKI